MELPKPDPLAPMAIVESEDGAAAVWGDYPLYAFNYPELLQQCRIALARRTKSYPDLIERALITASDAAADLQAWEWLVAEWTWIVTGEGNLPPHGSLPARRMALDIALARINQQFARADRSHETYRQAHLIMALRWHLDRLREGAPAVHFFARFNRRARTGPATWSAAA